MAPAPFFPVLARAAVLGVATIVALTACGGAPKGTITNVQSSTPVTGASSAGDSASPRTSSAAASSSPAGQEPTKAAGTKPTSAKPSSTKTLYSDVSGLKSLGIDLNVGVLIDVADDGRDAYLEIGKDGVVDFTGTSKTDNTMMALKPAPVRARTEDTKNRVVIAPPFYNEDLGKGSCVADTAPGTLRLATCDPGAANQVWQVVPAGDSGQFELHGVKTDIRVNNGRITTGSPSYVGLQTIKFAA